MNNQNYSDLEAEIIDISPHRKRGNKYIKWFIFASVLILIALLSSVSVYTEALWFDSIGFASRFWYVFALGWILFAVFGIITFGILRGGFYALERLFGLDNLAPRRIIVNKQPLDINPSRFLRPLGWIVALIFGISYGFGLSEDWQTWAVYLHQPTTAVSDPIFGKPLEFYLFTLPVYQEIAGWLTTLFIILLVAAVLYAVLSAVPKQLITEEKKIAFDGFGKRAYAVISAILGILLLIAAWRVMLSRYAFLWNDHSSFSGVTYTEDHYLLPGLTAVAVALVVASLILFVNAFTKKGGR